MKTTQLTHPDRVYWPDVDVTKKDLADYYADIWHRIAPHIVERPLALLRCPDGINGDKFFQKHVWKGISPAIVPVRDPKSRSGTPLVSIRNIDGLIGLVQAAALEIHPWGSTITDWERPDRIVIDLDPGDGVSWTDIVVAAREVRARLEDAGLSAFVKTTGGKGLHVVSPLKRKADWSGAKAFAKSLAEAMAADTPQRYVATISKAKRRGKVLIDYLRNQRGATAVAPYSTRARPGAPVSMPLAWRELKPGLASSHFTIINASKKLRSQASDPWRDFRASAVPLPSLRRSK